MGISVNDVFLYKALEQNDDATGGGRPGPEIVESGNVNNLFPNIARTDHVEGDVCLRKVFLRINSTGADIYAGAHAALKTIPSDSLVDVVLIPSAGHDEVRSEVIAAMEDPTVQAFLGASFLSQAVLAGAKDLYVDEVDKCILPVAFSEIPYQFGSSAPWIYTGEDQPGTPYSYHSKAVDGVPTSGYTYFVELENNVGIVAQVPYLFARIEGVWREYRKSSSGTIFVPTWETGSSAYTITNDVLAFTLPNNRFPDPGTKIIVCWRGRFYADALAVHTQSKDPVIPGSVSLEIAKALGGTFTAADDGFGAMTGTGISGSIDYQTGLIEIAVTGDDVKPSEGFTISFDFAAAVNEFDGFDPKKWPSNGRMPVFKPGDMIVIYDIVYENSEMALVTGVDIENKKITINSALTLPHDADTTLISSIVDFEDLQAKTTVKFTQKTWDLVTWNDTVSGDPAPAAYDYNNYPIVLTNKGATTERWAFRIKSLSPLTCDVYGEHLGLIGSNIPCTGIIGDPNDPLNDPTRLTNPVSGLPYLTLSPSGWGSGWQVGNIFRFNTEGAEAPFWAIRTIEPTPSEITDDSATVELRGNVDAET
jgi:hypothetical protein